MVPENVYIDQNKTDTASLELLAHGRTLEEMTSLIQCDALVFQTLDDLKAACLEAADGKSQVKDFEVGVFCGQYKTPLPADYFERSSQQNRNNQRNGMRIVGEEGDASATLVASSGPVGVAASQEEADANDAQGSRHQEDIRYTCPVNLIIQSWRAARLTCLQSL